MAEARMATWDQLRDFALSLDLPRVEQDTSWGKPCLKAHGKLWTWWSPHEDAAVFKVPVEERDILIESEPACFFVTDHYRAHRLVLVRPAHLDWDWARANLMRVWRDQAPKRFLKAFDAGETDAAAR